jgi:hypothetical protein
MFISNSRNFIYIHIPKCGGTSVTRILAKEATWQDLIIGDDEPVRTVTQSWCVRFMMYKHSRPANIEKALGSDAYRTFEKFVTVRHPIERIKSTYNFFKVNITNRSAWFVESPDFLEIDGMESLESFVKGRYFKQAIEVDPSKATDLQLCIAPQTIYFDADEARAGRYHFFHLDSLTKSCAPLVERSFLSAPQEFPHENRAERFDDSISSSTTTRLQRIFEIDFRTFGFDSPP